MIDKNITEVIGYAAAFLTTIAFVPQVLQTWRTRDLAGISLGMYAGFSAGVALWLIYGWLLSAWPIVIANGCTLILGSIILSLKIQSIKNRKKS